VLEALDLSVTEAAKGLGAVRSSPTSKSHAWPAAILVDEFDAGAL
jgi:hypothetical protein